MEMDLLLMVLKQMNLTFVHVHTPKGFEIENFLTDNLNSALIAKDASIALGKLGTRIMFDPFLDSANSHFIMSHRWYVPCSDKYSRWSSMFRIFSLELWLVLMISIVIAAISITLIGRYSFTSEWQRYKTLPSSLTNVWAVLLGVSVSTMPRSPSPRSLFLAWVYFSLVFSTVFQAFLTTFLIDSGYRTPIRNLEELLSSGIKLAFFSKYNYILENYYETYISKIKRNRVSYPSKTESFKLAVYHKNISFFTPDINAEILNENAYNLSKSLEPFLCKLENDLVYNEGIRMVMLYGDPLLRRVSEIIDRVVEAGFYNFWISRFQHNRKVIYHIQHTVHRLDGYYSLNLHHMRPVFYLLLIGWCLSSLCFIFELLYIRLLS